MTNKRSFKKYTKNTFTDGGSVMEACLVGLILFAVS